MNALERLEECVARAIALDLDESLIYGHLRGAERAGETFESHARRVIASANARYAQKTSTLGEVVPPNVCTIKSWQYGFTAADDRDQAARARDDTIYIGLQSYRCARLSGAEWRRFLDAGDDPGRWLALAREDEAEGKVVRANACIAAARWLDPEGTREEVASIVAARSGPLPARVRNQPDPTWRRERFGQRHWLAWDMKNYGQIDVPSLIAGACDENFSVRARVYRSLGQVAHPAALHCLLEGTYDPHFFARAQAARSLGWCSHPRAIQRLSEMATDDVDGEARRSAEKARQRIVAYWRHFGEWSRLFSDPVAMEAAVRALADDGLVEAARDFVAYVHGRTPEARALHQRLEPRSRSAEQLERRRYGYWFPDARRDEDSIAAATDTDEELARAISGEDREARRRALLVMTRHGRTVLRELVEPFARWTGAPGWGARRVYRAFGWSLPAAHPV